MAYNFSNLGKIHSCPSFIVWYYWIIKHSYFLKIERDFLCPPPRPLPAFPAASTGSGRGRGSQCFAWVQAHIALFILDCIIGPCRQRLISHREFPTKVAWVLGETRGEIASRCHLVSSHGCEGGHVRKCKEQGLWRHTEQTLSWAIY